MSRQAANKGRNEKGKTASAPTPAIAHDIVPGKLTDHDWHLMLDHDDGGDFAIDVIEEVCASAMDVIYSKYLEKQLIPYIVSQAKDAILQITEWQFLFKDKGETSIESDPAWLEDEEPPPAITDCWAQGSVPCRVATPVSARPPTIQEEREGEEKEDQEQAEDQSADSQDQEKANQQEERPPSVQIAANEQKQEDYKTPASTPAPENTETPQKKRKFKPHRGKLGSAHVGKMTDSLDRTEMEMLLAELSPLYAQSPDPESLQMPNSCHSLLKLQAGRPPAQRDVTFDSNTGNATMLRKINPARLPSHRVKTNFQIMDPATEAAQARLDAMRTGRHANAKVPQPPKAQPPTRNRSRTKAVSSQQISTDSAAVSAGMLPQLLELMELSPGVTLKEGERVKRGPKPYSRTAELRREGNNYSLRPVSMKVDNTRITVQDLLDRQSPTVRPLAESPPIPPILPHPPSQAV